MKIFIVGCGTLGSTSAFALAVRGIADELVLYDNVPQLAIHHAMDIEQAACVVSKTNVRATDNWDDIAGSDVVIISAGLPADKRTGNNDIDVVQFAPMIREMSDAIKASAPNAVIISMTNPLDVFTYLIYKVGALPAERVVGFTYNDTLRMRWGIAKYYGVPASDVSAFACGPHRSLRVQLFSTVRIKGEKKFISAQEQADITALQKRWWEDFDGTGIKRTAGWTCAVGIVDMVETIMGIRTDLVTCSCILNDVNGFSDISMGVIAKLGRSGVEKILPFQDLTEDEMQALNHSAAQVSKKIQKALSLI